MAGYGQSRGASTYVASWDTINSRVIQRETMELPDVGIAHVDEAHLSITTSRKRIIRRLEPNCFILGWTATPSRGNGGGMGEVYDDLIIGPSPQELMDMGVLCRPIYYGCPADIDFDELEYSKATGDYTSAAMEEIEDKATLIGDVVTNWERLAKDRHTVVFGASTKHARNLCLEFQRKGYKAASIDYMTPEPERASILERVASRKIQVLCNVFIASYGLDIPSLDCAVIARPTKNIALYLQTVGRVLRRFPGKTDALIIDHVRAIQENGFAEDAQPWCLDSASTVKERKEQEQKEKKEPRAITCPSCQFVFRSSRICPKCGHAAVPPNEQIPAFEYTLEEIKQTSVNALTYRNKNTPVDEKESFIRQLNFIARQSGYRQGWVSHKYRAHFGVWPSKINRDGTEVPTSETYQIIQQENRRKFLTETESLLR